VQYLAENMMGRTFCPLGDAAAMPTLGFVKKFRKEFEDYIDGQEGRERPSSPWTSWAGAH
jgi:NADH-quinone oxidoreductase subunit F